MQLTKPRCVGYWAVQVTPQMDLIKWGHDGDTVKPYKTSNQALAQLKFLCKQEPNCNYYMLKLFDNGQMKTFDYEF